MKTPDESMLGKTTCAKCQEEIAAGDYRVVLMAVEMRPEDFGENLPAGRGISLYQSFCDVCLAHMETLELHNVWKDLSDDGADPSAGPRNEDVGYRAVSLPGLAEKRARAAEEEGGKSETSAEAIEAELNSTNTPSRPEPELATEGNLRERMYSFLQTPAAKQMPKQVRIVAGKWSSGETQGQIATAIGVNQSSVSRLLDQAKRYLYPKAS